MALEHIGQKLKIARDGLGLSLSQIHERTKIPFNHLQSIDNGQSEDLPEPVYVSGFIKRYAECVGLNGQQLVDEYKEQAEGTTPTDVRLGFLPRSLKEQQPAAPPPTNYFNRTRIEQPPPNLFKMLLFPTLWIGLSLIGLIFLASRQQNVEVAQDPSVLSLKNSTAKFTGLPTTTPASQETANSPADSASQELPAPPSPPASHDARVVLTGNRHVWVTVKSVSTGEVKYTGFLDTGDRRDFQDSEGLRITAGSGGNLSVEVDGKTETFGAPGKRVERVFLAKNAAPAPEKAENKPDTATASKPGAGGSANSSSTQASALKKTPPSKKTIAAARDRALRRSDSLPASPYIPGESLGSGTREMDVPYRY